MKKTSKKENQLYYTSIEITVDRRRGKNTKYFINLEKRNHDKKYIKKLITDNGKEIINQKDIVKEQMNFCEKLYSTRNLQKDNRDFLTSKKVPKLAKDLKENCELPIHRRVRSSAEQITK